MGFVGGFLTGKSISRRTSGGGGFGGKAVSIAHMTQAARGVINPADDAPLIFKEVMANIAEVKIQVAFDANTSDDGEGDYRKVDQTGTRAPDQARDYMHFQAGQALVLDASDETGFQGYVDFSAANHLGYVTIDQDVWNRNANQDRSWVYAWSNVSGLTSNNQYGFVNDAGTNNNGSGWLMTDTGAGTWKTQYLNGGSGNIVYDTSHSHTTAGSSESLSLSAGKLNILALSWDESAKQVTARWKQTGHGSGHSFETITASDQLGSANLQGYYVIGYWQLTAITTRWRYIGVVDQVIGASEFNDLVATTDI